MNQKFHTDALSETDITRNLLSMQRMNVEVGVEYCITIQFDSYSLELLKLCVKSQLGG